LQASRFDSKAGGQGMLVVETVARIRREHFIKGKTIKEIARDLKVSRNTVRKVLRSGETSFVNAGAKMHRFAGAKMHQRYSRKSPRTGGFFVRPQALVGLSAVVSELTRRERRLLWLSL
jgi:excisionase family DNA binding protein